MLIGTCFHLFYQKHLPDFDRKLAETHYNLGLAYSFDRKYDSALEQYRMALDVLEKRIGNAFFFVLA